MTGLFAPWLAFAAATGGYTVSYAGYTYGFRVLAVTGSLALADGHYDLRVAFHTTGLAGLVLAADSDSHAAGGFVDGRPQPFLFESAGHLRGAARTTRITYVKGDPLVQALVPPPEQERSAVPAADTQHTIDTLSAIVLLLRQLGRGAPCDGTARIFDGRRLLVQSVHSAGADLLERTGRSIFAGRATRCAFEGAQLGGFVRTQDEAEQRQPRRGTAWLADMIAGAPPIPVRIVFEHRLLGRITLYLTAVAPAG